MTSGGQPFRPTSLMPESHSSPTIMKTMSPAKCQPDPGIIPDFSPPNTPYAIYHWALSAKPLKLVLTQTLAAPPSPSHPHRLLPRLLQQASDRSALLSPLPGTICVLQATRGIPLQHKSDPIPPLLKILLWSHLTRSQSQRFVNRLPHLCHPLPSPPYVLCSSPTEATLLSVVLHVGQAHSNLRAFALTAPSAGLLFPRFPELAGNHHFLQLSL